MELINNPPFQPRLLSNDLVLYHAGNSLSVCEPSREQFRTEVTPCLHLTFTVKCIKIVIFYISSFLSRQAGDSNRNQQHVISWTTDGK